MVESGLKKRTALIAHLQSLPSLAIAFSGGVDSSLLVAVAARETSIPLLAVTGISASLSQHQLSQAKRVAKSLDVTHRLLETHELNNPSYTSNPTNRCFFCKEELFSKIQSVLGASWPVIADGNNLDDCQDFRPGREAGKKAGVISPFVVAKLDKNAIRAWSRDLGLETAELPASPCLSSRIQTGIPVNSSALQRIEHAEEEMRKLGFLDFRVRDLGDTARLEVAGEEHDKLSAPEIQQAARSLLLFSGFTEVIIDDRPLRSGRLHLDQSILGSKATENLS